MFAKVIRLGLLLLVGFALNQSAHSQTYTVIYRFSNARLHGAHPNAGLIMDAVGNLYGTTKVGGTANLGTVFKLDPSGNQSVLYSFLGGADGANPTASLIRDANGNFYGTTRLGGTSNLGTVFKLAPNGNETVLHSFAPQPDGAQPYGSLVRDSAGNLYGTTFFGGAFGKGTAFKVDTSGNETVLHSFVGVNGDDGAHPAAGLIRDASGNFYGTTRGGGVHGGGNGPREGTIFKMTSTGQVTVLFSFSIHATDGLQPVAPLIMDGDGNLYGTTKKGGPVGTAGTVFKFALSGGGFTQLHSFNGTDGDFPLAGLVRDVAGNLYGTTSSNSGCNCGVVFKLDPTGVETVLHAFTGGSDGKKPVAELLMDSAGNLYGTTQVGGISNAGTIFKITP